MRRVMAIAILPYLDVRQSYDAHPVVQVTTPIDLVRRLYMVAPRDVLVIVA